MKPKLVRDNIPQIIEASGRKAKTRVLDDEEYKGRLLGKLQEEVNEFLDNQSIEELADILEVIDCLKNAYSINEDELIKIKNDKKKTRGSFNKKIFLEEIN